MIARAAAEIELATAGIVWPADRRRESIIAVSGRRLLAISEADLRVRATWRLPKGALGWHAADADLGVAVVCTRDKVVLVERDGHRRWAHPHPPWTGDFESGCAWLSDGGAFAVVPAPGYAGSHILQLDLATGIPRSTLTIDTAPAGVRPLRHLDGWVGLCVGEGQDACKAWWLRSIDAGAEVELLDAGWTHRILADVSPDGGRILTTPHVDGPIEVLAFPSLRVEREIDPAPDMSWDFGAYFAGELIVARVIDDDGEETTVVIAADGAIEVIDIGAGSLRPARDGVITVEPSRILRWELR